MRQAGDQEFKAIHPSRPISNQANKHRLRLFIYLFIRLLLVFTKYPGKKFKIANSLLKAAKQAAAMGGP